mmetsp:Transcript_29054/g.68290  ORF Transcript_29054/g.68290 Transcript_29054/m.68290 type:complete len:317 (+) Transcript_29054:174-1124(+)
MTTCNSSVGRRAVLLLAKKQQRQQLLSSPSPLQSSASARRLYSSSKTSYKKDLPPPLPPKSTNTKIKGDQGLSPAKAKKEYLEAQKRTGEFLQDPQANILRLQKEMNETKAKLLTVHDKPIWRRVADRFKAKKHSVINLLCASMAYILAHRLHLKMKANKELEEQVEAELAKNSELRALLRSLTTDELVREVVSEATSAGDEQNTEVDTNKNDTSTSTWWLTRTNATKSVSSSSTDKDRLADALRTKLQARIGDEGLEDAERKEKNMKEIWKENEKRIEETEEGLSAALATAALEEQQPGETSATTSSTKKRVFDM